jgi:hypothetical protein
MIEFIVVLGLAGVGAYATLKGTFGAAAEAYAKKVEAGAKADLTKLKADASAELTKIEAAGSADVKAAVAELKKLF